MVMLFFMGLITGAQSKVMASEGTIEMKSTTTQDSRCFGFSMLDTDNQFHISLSCRNLIYPPSPNQPHYVLWARQTEDNKEVNLGTLGYGRISNKMKKAFNSLFVTKENNAKTRNPSQDVVMTGTIKPITFFDNMTEVISCDNCPKEGESETAAAEIETEIEAEQEPANRTKELLTKGGPLIIVVSGVIGLLFLIYIVSKKG